VVSCLETKPLIVPYVLDYCSLLRRNLLTERTMRLQDTSSTRTIHTTADAVAVPVFVPGLDPVRGVPR
jgi:hypothetical protein